MGVGMAGQAGQMVGDLRPGLLLRGLCMASGPPSSLSWLLWPGLPCYSHLPNPTTLPCLPWGECGLVWTKGNLTVAWLA